MQNQSIEDLKHKMTKQTLKGKHNNTSCWIIQNLLMTLIIK